jgi:hypothetical protein
VRSTASTGPWRGFRRQPTAAPLSTSASTFCLRRIPLGFAFADPGANALAAAVLLAAFVGTGTSFLAYAVIAEKRGLKSEAYPTKSFYYLGGLTEGAETIAAFLAMCWWPQYFPGIAYVYAAMCTVTTVTRLLAGWQAFGGDARS